MRTGFSSPHCSRLTQGFIRSWNKPDGSKLRLYLNGHTFQIEEINQNARSIVIEKEGPWKLIQGIPDKLHAHSLTRIRDYFQHTYVKISHTKCGKRIFSIFQKGFGGTLTSERFIHQGINYSIKQTRGYGSCAMHALLGEECSGEYRFPGEESTSSSRAKTHFTDALKNALDHANLTVHNIFVEMIYDYLNNPNTNASAQLLFNNEKGQEFQNQWGRLKAEEAFGRQTICLKEAEIWKTAFNNNPTLRQMILHSAQLKTIYSGYESAQIETLVLAEPLRLLDIVNEGRDPHMALLENSSKLEVTACQNELQHHLETIENRKRAFCSQPFSHYIETVNMPEYYLNTNEIKLAAHLFQRNVLIFAEDFTLAEDIRVLNANELIVIWHQGDHFSRCVATVDLELDMANLNLNEKNSTEDERINFAKNFHAMEVELEGSVPETDEDALPSSVFAPTLQINSEESLLHFRTLMNPPNPEASQEALQHLLELMPEEDSQRIRYRFCQAFVDTPAALIEMLDKSGLPILQDLELRIPALKNLITAAESELKKTQEDLVRQTSGFEELLSHSESLTETVNRLKLQLAKAEQQQKSVRKECQDELSSLLKNFFVDRDQARKSFYKVRELNPWAIAPFLPFIAIVPDFFEEDLLAEMLQGAYTCDPYRTYANVLYYIRASLTLNRDIETLNRDIKNGVLVNLVQKFYPNDLFVNAITQKPDFETTRIGIYLSLSLQQLAFNQNKAAILTLVKAKQQFMGFSIVHQYLALAWMLNGEIEKATALLKRASYQMDTKSNPSNLITNAIVIMSSQMGIKIANESIKKNTPLPPTLPDKLLIFLQQNFSEQTATAFVIECTTALMNDAQLLPWVYFGTRWLISQIALSHKQFPIELWKEIQSLLSVCAYIHHEASNGNTDPWIAEQFTLEENVTEGTRYIIEFSITFGTKQEEEFPKFQFNAFELSRESLSSIALILTKQLYSLSIAFLSSYAFSQQLLSDEDEVVPLIDDLALFSAILCQGLQLGISSSNEFRRAYKLLNTYTALKTKPFIISSDILSWARLCTRWAIPDDRQEPLLAVTRINARSTAGLEVTLPTDDEGIYRVFETSQLLFGWRAGESFAEWGMRLSENASSGPFAADHKTTHETSKTQLHSTVIVPTQAKKTYLILKHIFAFWIEFHRKTVEKNIHIAGGGDEDGVSSKRKLEFHEGLQEGVWRAIVKDNTPEKHPRFKTNKNELINIVKKKNNHALEIKELRKLYLQKTKEKMSAGDFEIYTICHILKQVEKPRTQASPNVWIREEQEAIRLYRILLEITIDRLITAELARLGPDAWSVKDSTAAAALLINVLTHCEGKFHGPETHASGDAPLHWHYNAHVHTSKHHLANVHLFYGDL